MATTTANPATGCPCGLPCPAFQYLLDDYITECRRDIVAFARRVYAEPPGGQCRHRHRLLTATGLDRMGAAEMRAVAGTACLLVLSFLPARVVHRGGCVDVGISKAIRAVQVLTGAGGVANPGPRNLRVMGEVDGVGMCPITNRAVAVLGWAPLAHAPGRGAWFLHACLAGLGSKAERWAMATSLAGGAVRLLQRTPDAADIRRITVAFDLTSCGAGSLRLRPRTLAFLLRWARAEEGRCHDGAVGATRQRHALSFWLAVLTWSGTWFAGQDSGWKPVRVSAETGSLADSLRDDSVLIIVRHWDGPGTMIGSGASTRAGGISSLALHNPATAHRVSLAGGNGVRIAPCTGLSDAHWNRLYRDTHGV